MALVSAVMQLQVPLNLGNLYSIGAGISFTGRVPLHGECKDRHSDRTHTEYMSGVQLYLARFEALTAVMMIKSVLWRLVCW